MKPRCKLIGIEGGIPNLLELVSRSLRDAGQVEAEREMRARVLKVFNEDDSFIVALDVFMDYVTIE